MVLPGEYEVDDSGFVIKMLTWHCSSNTGNQNKPKKTPPNVKTNTNEQVVPKMLNKQHTQYWLYTVVYMYFKR